MKYQLKLKRSAQKQLDRITGRDYEAIAKAISALVDEPWPMRVKKLANCDLWRIRVGQYRVVYSVDDNERQVIVVRVAKRTGGTYKGL